MERKRTAAGGPEVARSRSRPASLSTAAAPSAYCARCAAMAEPAHCREPPPGSPRQGRAQWRAAPRRCRGPRLRGWSCAVWIADEAVHHAPDRAEQADEGRCRADSREHAGRARETPSTARLEPLEPRGDAILYAFAVKARQVPHFLERFIDCCFKAAGPFSAAPASATLADRPMTAICRRKVLAPSANSIPFASATVQVAIDARARIAITALTKLSAARNIPQGVRSGGGTVARTGRPSCPERRRKRQARRRTQRRA